jgi:hypothetical protein
MKDDRITIMFTEMDYDPEYPDAKTFQSVCRKRDCHTMAFLCSEPQNRAIVFCNEDLTPRFRMELSPGNYDESEEDRLFREFEKGYPPLPSYLLVREIRRTESIQEKLDTLLYNEELLKKQVAVNIHQKVLKEVIVRKFHPNINILSIEADCLWYYARLVGAGVGYGYSLGYPGTIDSNLKDHPFISQHEFRILPFCLRTVGRVEILLDIFVSLDIHNFSDIVDLMNGTYGYENERLLSFYKTGVAIGLAFNLDEDFSLFLDIASLSFLLGINNTDVLFDGGHFSGSLGGFGIMARF